MEALRVKATTNERKFLEKEALLNSTKQLLQEALAQLETNHIDQTNQAQIVASLQFVEQQITFLKIVNQQLVDVRMKQRQQRGSLELLQEKHIKLERYLADQTQELTKQRAIVEEQQKHIPENSKTLQSLKQAIADIASQKVVLQTAWHTSQQSLQTSKEAVNGAKKAVEITKQAVEELKLKMDERREQFSESMRIAGFRNFEEFTAAKRNEYQLEALRKACSDYTLQIHTLQVQITEGAKHLQGKEKQDLALMEEKLEKYRVTYEDAFKVLQQMKGFAKACEDFIERIEETAQEIRLLEKEAGRVKELYAMLNGQNTKKLSFERYIQINYLDKITEAANVRLQHLSNGQFELRRSDRLEKHAKQSGLGLDVYDAYTDQLRDVKTLSGGEKFNASLSLALGMADVIQSFQGNIHIETMFIDEGFGSLDEEALNKAIDTLIDLQDSGRMIGVISHVAELKATMPAVLHVEKTMNGHSQTYFEVK